MRLLFLQLMSRMICLEDPIEASTLEYEIIIIQTQAHQFILLYFSYSFY